ncbi:MAG TPA: hypothetical protein VFH92_04315 [Phenylobacterium sp.]|nr:hypothetical protein [Phenylobacterium sp.]
MRTLLTLTLCGAVSAPGAVLAQAAGPSAEGRLAPDQPPFSDPVTPAQPAVTAAPAPSVEPAGTRPPTLAGPATVAPVLVEAKPQPQSNMTRKVGVTVGGLLGGVAGAAAGPVGKFAGSLLGKRMARGLLDRDTGSDVPQLEVTQAAPSAADAGKPALAEPATAPALVAVSDPSPPR